MLVGLAGAGVAVAVNLTAGVLTLAAGPIAPCAETFCKPKLNENAKTKTDKINMYFFITLLYHFIAQRALSAEISVSVREILVPSLNLYIIAFGSSTCSSPSAWPSSCASTRTSLALSLNS